MNNAADTKCRIFYSVCRSGSSKVFIVIVTALVDLIENSILQTYLEEIRTSNIFHMIKIN